LEIDLSMLDSDPRLQRLTHILQYLGVGWKPTLA
jgi:hypothetical protein